MTASTGSATNSPQHQSPSASPEPKIVDVDPSIIQSENANNLQDLDTSGILDGLQNLDLGPDGDSASLTESLETELSTSDEHFEKIVHS